MLPASIQVCPVEIPGRGRRVNEAAVNDVHQLADLLASSLPLQVNDHTYQSEWLHLDRCLCKGECLLSFAEPKGHSTRKVIAANSESLCFD